MTREEIFQRFHNMQGKAGDRIKILAQMTGHTESSIKKLLQEIEAQHLDLSSYHPDDNPHCRVEVKINTAEAGDIPEHVLDLIFDRLDELDREIKERQDEYNELVAYIGGKQA